VTKRVPLHGPERDPALRFNPGVDHPEAAMLVEQHIPRDKGLQKAWEPHAVSPLQNGREECATYPPTPTAEGNAEQRQIPVGAWHTPVMDEIKMAIRDTAGLVSAALRGYRKPFPRDALRAGAALTPAASRSPPS
jgi:hypothetical protein